MNLIPKAGSGAPHYWCSWQLQNIWAATANASNAFGSTGHSAIAAVLTEDALEKLWQTPMLDGVRQDLYALLDLGWDAAKGEDFDGRNWMLGSMILAEDKFPSCGGTPVERLRKLNERVRSLGFKGLGLWIPANAYGEGKDGAAFSREELTAFYRERFGWMRDAGIRYLKMDYGLHAHDLAFREWITRFAREIDPDLLVEHAYNCGPFNDDFTPWDTPDITRSGRFDAWENGMKARFFQETVQRSRVFRTYDVSFSLAIPTTLDRAVSALRADTAHGEACIISVESQPEIAAALGCTMGIMECYTPAQENACKRALRWQRLAPAWPVGDAVALSSERCDDCLSFPQKDDWVDFLPAEYAVRQGAPCVIARGRALPKVSGSDERPYLICSRHPNGAQCIAALPRRREQGFFLPLTDAEMDGCAADCPIGVFGRFASLTLRFDEPLQGRRVWAQDLLCGEAADITERCTPLDNAITLPGSLLDELCAAHADRPGFVLRLTHPKEA